MSEAQYRVTVQANTEGKPYFDIPDAMWKEVTRLGWRVGDELTYHAEPGWLRIINPGAKNRRET